MDPLHDPDPWTDTTARRGDERDNPLDSGHAGNPFGTLSEVAGVPNFTHQPRTNRTTQHGGRPRRVRWILAVLLAAGPLAGIIAAVWQLAT